LSLYIKDTDIKVALLVGSMKVSEKKKVYQMLESGDIDILIGTHALISEGVTFKNLGFVITDEQHRFGVNQRTEFKNKGVSPDVLSMSATPIPRSMAIAFF
jgi:ATP-dependent DNA helicase RecG